MVDSAALEKIAAACRKGLLGLTGKSGSVFQGFPRAACGPAAEILGRIVKEMLDCDGIYMCAQMATHSSITSIRMLGLRSGISYST